MTTNGEGSMNQNIAPMTDDLLPLSDGAAALGEHPARTFARVSRGELPGRRIGRQWFLDGNALRRLVEGRRAATTA